MVVCRFIFTFAVLNLGKLAILRGYFSNKTLRINH